MVTPDGPPPPEPQPYPQYVAPRRPNATVLVIGLVIGLVVGAGIMTLAWQLSSSPTSGPAADAAAVCGVVERTPDPPADLRDISLEYMQRWSISEMATSIAKTDAKYQPLADSLNTVFKSIRNFDLKRLQSSIQEVRAACDQL